MILLRPRELIYDVLVVTYLRCILLFLALFFFFFNDTATTEIYTLSLHDALPIFHRRRRVRTRAAGPDGVGCSREQPRSEEHTSELQSRFDLVCRLLLEKKKKKKSKYNHYR